MEKKGFKMTDKIMKTDKVVRNLHLENWCDGLRSDPIFISVWTK